MSLKSVSVQAAQELLARGALLVDIRAADEYAREHIAQARRLPLEKLAGGAAAVADGVVIFIAARATAPSSTPRRWPPARAKPMYCRAAWMPGKRPACRCSPMRLSRWNCSARCRSSLAR